MSRSLFAALLALIALPAVAQENGDLIVQLSHVDSVSKCFQAAIEFNQQDWAVLGQEVVRIADERGLPQAERQRLWGMGQLMSIAETTPETRADLPTWFPGIIRKP
jgi:hypothetical protein